MKLLGKLKGKKTYLGAALAIVFGISGFLMEQHSASVAIRMISEGVMGLGLRHALSGTTLTIIESILAYLLKNLQQKQADELHEDYQSEDLDSLIIKHREVLINVPSTTQSNPEHEKYKNENMADSIGDQHS